MTRHHIAFAVAIACSSVLGLQSLEAQTKGFRAPEDWPAEVSLDKIIFSFPLPYSEVEKPKPPTLGHYAWRVTIESKPATSFVLFTTKPIATDQFKDLIEASTLRLCPATTSTIEECTTPLKGNGHVSGERVTIDIRDLTIVNQIRKLRPEAYWRTVIEPGGHYQVDQLYFLYKR